MKSKQMCGVVLALFMGLFAVGSSQAAVISLVSGVGALGTADANVRMQVGAASGLAAAAFTLADFTAASTGPSAIITSATHAQWVPNGTIAGAQWISTSALGYQNLAANPAGSSSNALYAISFNLTSIALSNAVLNVTAYADNLLGGTNNVGMFINGVAIAGSSTVTNSFTLAGGKTLTNVNILPSLVVGTNWLYFNVVNASIGPSGLMFGATITTTPTTVSVPAPGVIALLGLGLLLLVMFGNKQGMFALTKKQ